MLKTDVLVGVRGGLSATGPDEGCPTRKCRSVRSRTPSVGRPSMLPVFFRAPSLIASEIETDPIPDQVQVLAQEVYAIDLLPLLANNLHRLDFEVGTPVYSPHPASSLISAKLSIN